MTIVAPATGPAAGGVGILRISGPNALQCALGSVRGVPANPRPRHAYLVEVVDGQGAVLDEGLFLYFQAPASFTGEDVVELQTHGSPRLLSMLQQQLLQQSGVRLAEPGEFTRRAFLNGRMDLSKAEAVADLVSASSEAAVRSAAAGLQGALRERLDPLKEQLLALRADLEAVFEFPDEAFGAEEEASARLDNALATARRLSLDVGRGALVRRGARVVLFGPANAGKSTLFNRLIGEERALVDEEAGTTRDVLEVRVEWDGLPLLLFDTAGLREGAGRVEELGIARARAALTQADLAVLLCPPGVSEEEEARWRAEAGQVPLLLVRSKADLREGPAATGEPNVLYVSSRAQEGVERLRRAVLDALGGGVSEAVLYASARQLEALRRAQGHLEHARQAIDVSTLEVVAGEVGLGLEALAEITGEDAAEALLDEIFRRFCIGK